MELEGGCHCGAVRYRVSGEPQRCSLCHCSDCRKAAGAPVVAWLAVAEGDFSIIRGEPKVRNSSGQSMRSFCGDCGTPLFFTNAEWLPGIVDVQSATLDDPDAFPPGAQVQVADRIGWMAQAHRLPEFERFPGQ